VAALDEISKAKNSLLSPDEYEAKATSFFGERLAKVYREYDRRLRESNGLDFDDLELGVRFLRHAAAHIGTPTFA